MFREPRGRSRLFQPQNHRADDNFLNRVLPRLSQSTRSSGKPAPPRSLCCRRPLQHISSLQHPFLVLRNASFLAHVGAYRSLNRSVHARDKSTSMCGGRCSLNEGHERFTGTFNPCSCDFVIETSRTVCPAKGGLGTR